MIWRQQLKDMWYSMMTGSNQIWGFQSIVDSPKLAPIHIWIKQVSMCGTLFGRCTVGSCCLGVDMFSRLSKVYTSFSCVYLRYFHLHCLLTFVMESRHCASISTFACPILCLSCKAWHILWANWMQFFDQSEYNCGHAAICERSAGTRSTQWGEKRSFSQNFST